VQIKISARHGHLGDESQAYIRDKAQKLLRYFERLTMIEVTVDVKEEEKIVEFIAKAEHKHDFVAHERHPEIQTAVDMALHKIEGQIHRYKEKLQDHRRTPSMGNVKGAPQSTESAEE
jgi:putative sigma-54 modulation protein